MKKKLLFGIMTLALLLSSCKSDAEPTLTRAVLIPTPTPMPTVADTPTSPPPTPEVVRTFESARCPFELPADQVQGRTLDCGYLVVPENRADPDSASIRLAVAIFRHPDGAAEPDPIVYLAGGPGGSALELIYLTFDQYASVFDARRDLILLDQRGVGLSKPALDCPEFRELGLELLDWKVDGKLLTEQEGLDLVKASLLACGKDLDAVADLSAYNTAANAADVNDLRVALGYDQVNLWGTSYGTRLALGVMRDYPQGVRSVVLDSTYPPDVNLPLDTPANADRAANLFFQACAADDACNAAFPDLHAVFFDTVNRLNESPASFQAANALSGESYDVLLDGDSLMGFLFQFLYITDVLPLLPQIIYDASHDDLDKIALIFGSLLVQREMVSGGMQISVLCNEEFVFSTPQEFETVLAAHSEWSEFSENSIIGKLGFQICADWGAGQADAIENEPVNSDVPTLVMAGEYDPITPPAWGQRAAGTLTKGYFFEYPGVGHGASLAGDCPRDMLLAFLDDPTTAPDDACIADMGDLQFIVPAEGVQTVEFEPLTSEEFGFRGLAPVGWEKLAPTKFMRGESALDPTVLIQEAAPVSANVWLDNLPEQLRLDDAPQSAGSRAAGDLTWDLYSFEIQGQAADLALAEHSDQTYMVLLVSTSGERDALYEGVFLPVVEALRPTE